MQDNSITNTTHNLNYADKFTNTNTTVNPIELPDPSLNGSNQAPALPLSPVPSRPDTPMSEEQQLLNRMAQLPDAKPLEYYEQYQALSNEEAIDALNELYQKKRKQAEAEKKAEEDSDDKQKKLDDEEEENKINQIIDSLLANEIKKEKEEGKEKPSSDYLKIKQNQLLETIKAVLISEVNNIAENKDLFLQYINNPEKFVPAFTPDGKAICLANSKGVNVFTITNDPQQIEQIKNALPEEYKNKLEAQEKLQVQGIDGDKNKENGAGANIKGDGSNGGCITIPLNPLIAASMGILCAFGPIGAFAALILCLKCIGKYKKLHLPPSEGKSAPAEKSNIGDVKIKDKESKIVMSENDDVGGALICDKKLQNQNIEDKPQIKNEETKSQIKNDETKSQSQNSEYRSQSQTREPAALNAFNNIQNGGKNQKQAIAQPRTQGMQATVKNNASNTPAPKINVINLPYLPTGTKVYTEKGSYRTK